MGRRKIEIQPITHERNRSVTFLKSTYLFLSFSVFFTTLHDVVIIVLQRKNGLFKKAYELGVLCSIDVAVIIFEEKPGHHVKLYEYCSSDISEIVNRRLRHDGEKDTLGPAHFSGSANKTEDAGDGDDDDGEDEEDTHQRGTKRRIDGTRPSNLKFSLSFHLSFPGGDAHLTQTYPPHRGLHAIPLHNISQGSGGNAPSLPVSSDRSVLRSGGGGGSGASLQHHHSHPSQPSGNPNKKLRMAGGISVSTGSHRSSSDADPVSASSAGGSAAGGAGYGTYTSSPTSGYSTRGGGGGSQYNSVFPLSSSTPNLIPPTYDFRSGAPPGPGTGASTGSGQQRMGNYSSTPPTGLYGQSMNRSSNTNGSGTHGGDGGTSDIFSFLHDDAGPGNSRGSGTGGNSGGGGYSSSLSWPEGSSVPPGSNTSQSGSTNDNWLDFLSHSSHPGGGGGGSSRGGRRSIGNSMSWERNAGSGHRVDTVRIGSVTGRRSRLGSHSGGEEDDHDFGNNRSRSNGVGTEIKKEKEL
ncbi:hypothetical protein D9758_002989 [Tetrapyrgos nigripes]|uniref:MADS-box domain-containing protein n=1 Tax=Tetrapyrgos nigripes TaxID=182062 RepID=A0A8H5GQ94_9AGAR|nr:hypothetical protein D9758_002989 [Tetrapyrgos nigripes]